MDATRWFIALGLIGFGLIGITLLDKQREGDCRDAIELLQTQPTASEATIVNRAGEGAGCDGFLPW